MIGVQLPLDELLMHTDRDLLLAYTLIVDRAIDHFNKMHSG